MSNIIPKITFGIIVLNGEPFTLYNLRSVYPFAHEVIIVEGGSKNSLQYAPEGHSTDGTLETLYRFKKEEDKEDKLQIITRPGLWNEKTEQSQAYAERASGDYIWQIDIDEFYKKKDIYDICKLLMDDPSINGIGFKWKNFWGDFDVLADSWIVRQCEREWNGFPRVFRWQKGFRYANHRPPVVIDNSGLDLRKGRWISGNSMAKMGIFCYHYGMIFDKQARQKTFYYKDMWPSHKDMERWYDEEFLNLKKPFNILHGTKKYSWLKRFSGTHPEQIICLIENLDTNSKFYRRGNRIAIERVLASKSYYLATCLLLLVEPVFWFFFKALYYIYANLEKKPFIANTLDHLFYVGKRRFKSTRSILRFYLRQVLLEFPNPNIIETGCIRNPKEGTNSTLAISSILKNKGNFWSFDIDPQCIEICKNVCSRNNKYIRYIMGDSVQMLKKLVDTGVFTTINLAYFDSLNCGEHIWNEFKAVQNCLIKGSIVIVDDVMYEGRKGDRIKPYLESSKEWEIKIFDVRNGVLVAKKI